MRICLTGLTGLELAHFRLLVSNQGTELFGNSRQYSHERPVVKPVHVYFRGKISPEERFKNQLIKGSQISSIINYFDGMNKPGFAYSN